MCNPVPHYLFKNLSIFLISVESIKIPMVNYIKVAASASWHPPEWQKRRSGKGTTEKIFTSAFELDAKSNLETQFQIPSNMKRILHNICGGDPKWTQHHKSSLADKFHQHNQIVGPPGTINIHCKWHLQTNRICDSSLVCDDLNHGYTGMLSPLATTTIIIIIAIIIAMHMAGIVAVVNLN